LRVPPASTDVNGLATANSTWISFSVRLTALFDLARRDQPFVKGGPVSDRVSSLAAHQPRAIECYDSRAPDLRNISKGRGVV
jgi:hypothetical protein